MEVLRLNLLLINEYPIEPFVDQIEDTSISFSYGPDWPSFSNNTLNTAPSGDRTGTLYDHHSSL